MPTLARIALLLLLTFGAVPALAETAFVHGIDDLPLMPGLAEVVGGSTVFDKPGGRIVETYATGKGISVDDVAKFYISTLPQLGWRRSGDLLFDRGKEELRLTVFEDGGTLTVQFNLAPR